MSRDKGLRLTRQLIVHAIGLLILAIFPLLAQIVGEPYYTTIASRVLIYAIAAVSLDLVLGFGGMVSFGHGAFFGIGGFAVGILTHHALEGSAVPFLPGDWTGTTLALIQFPIAIIAAGLAGLVIGALSLRTRGVYFIMITLAFAQMLYYMMISLPTYGGEDGLSIWQRSDVPALDLYDDTTFYYVVAVILLALLFLCSRITNSRFGMVLQACRQNEQRLEALGVPTYRYKLAAFILSAMGAGLAGALIANHNEFVGPGMLHWTRSGELMIMVILGGMGTLVGPVFGAVTLLFIEEILAQYTEHWMIILGPILIFVVLFAKRGVYGWLVGRSRLDD